jgi:hypothetical protein
VTVADVRTEPYSGSREHLAAEIAWLDRALGSVGEPGGEAWFAARERSVPEHLHRDRLDIAARLAATAGQGRLLALPRLRAAFGLSPEEELLLVAGAAARLRGRDEPSIALVAALAALDPRGPADGGALLDPYAPVYRWRLVEPNGGAATLDRSVLALLTGHGVADERIGAAIRPLPAGGPDSWPYETEADRLARALTDGPGAALAHFHGPLATEGRRVAVAVGHRLGIPLVHADVGELLALAHSGELAFADGLVLVYRHAALAAAAVYLSGFDALLAGPRAHAHLAALEALAAEAPGFTCTEGSRLWLPGAGWPARVAYLPLMPAALDHRRRRAAWIRAVPGLPDAEVETLATRFGSAPGQIADAVRLARSRNAAEPTAADLVWACRAPLEADLDGLARPVSPRADWPDLILPPDVLTQLRELCGQVQHRGRVLADWALARGPRGTGVSALFLGPSGTGKTLAAEVVAGAVGLDLLKVDLSTVVSKYIGETEKHLERLFTAAERSGSILFFDEADALFGKRSEVGDAHDRYANIEVSYLLQRIEDYPGVVVLATNFAQNLDEAFQRRLRVSVTFPFPDEAARLAIWRRHLPPELPVTGDLDLALMARRFKVSGGVISKIVWNAAFLAAAGTEARLGTEHLLLATRREYERMGKPFRVEEVAR